MGKHTFTNWLKLEVHAARCALLRLYEEEERLKYIEGPRLEHEYMEAIGHYEETVVREEMECELLTAKQRLVQAAINRREAIDEAAIEAKMAALREQMTKDASGDPPPQPYAELSPEHLNELQEIYSAIVRKYHPSMHPEMTQSERMLYEKAQNAYRLRDLSALRLIHEMLMASEDEGFQMVFEWSLDLNADESSAPSNHSMTDYSLASALYGCFVPLQEEAAMQEEWNLTTEKTNAMMEQLRQLQQTFPYSAKEMLADPQQIQAYKSELEQRMYSAQRERERLTLEIQTMIGGAKARG